MIVIFIDDIENFMAFLNKRIMNEIFYEFKERTSVDLSKKAENEVILHFLAMVGEAMVLYETKQIIPKKDGSDSEEQVINMVKKTLVQVDSSLTLIKGKIREVFLSYSS